MPLFEYLCDSCQFQFEQLISTSEKQEIPCPKCQGPHTHRLISRFAVGGRGDLRESTLHGCHDPGHGSEHESEDHGHVHDHSGGPSDSLE